MNCCIGGMKVDVAMWQTTGMWLVLTARGDINLSKFLVTQHRETHSLTRTPVHTSQPALSLSLPAQHFPNPADHVHRRVQRRDPDCVHRGPPVVVLGLLLQPQPQNRLRHASDSASSMWRTGAVRARRRR